MNICKQASKSPAPRFFGLTFKRMHVYVKNSFGTVYLTLIEVYLFIGLGVVLVPFIHRKTNGMLEKSVQFGALLGL